MYSGDEGRTDLNILGKQNCYVVGLTGFEDKGEGRPGVDGATYSGAAGGASGRSREDKSMLGEVGTSTPPGHPDSQASLS